jgi:hypothetical protein
MILGVNEMKPNGKRSFVECDWSKWAVVAKITAPIKKSTVENAAA